jgi:hypothetical protein
MFEIAGAAQPIVVSEEAISLTSYYFSDCRLELSHFSLDATRSRTWL